MTNKEELMVVFKSALIAAAVAGGSVILEYLKQQTAKSVVAK